MDWTNSAHVMQAVYWTLLFCIFINGYNIGSRAVIS
jgi:hypothetical protein